MHVVVAALDVAMAHPRRPLRDAVLERRVLQQKESVRVPLNDGLEIGAPVHVSGPDRAGHVRGLVKGAFHGHNGMCCCCC